MSFTKQYLVIILLLNAICYQSYASPIELGCITNVIQEYERKYDIPVGLLSAIARTESNYQPYTVNINGSSAYYTNKSDAKASIKAALSQNITNIDIGIMQINYKWHHKEFASVDEMLNLSNNIEYAATFLSRLYNQHQNWHKAISLYHSNNAQHHKKYSRKVVMSWLHSPFNKN